ncbi:unnamed protein product [Heligmosomoides polygyrus]|uniref:Uncharacterized protein n=1 Tax=Heligmosomoides polygyrus TaxID=6339 RepID=A0A183FVK5_HELPZ|nr:unnamed protein product [Heligmosomoides polygyrus]
MVANRWAWAVSRGGAHFHSGSEHAGHGYNSVGGIDHRNTELQSRAVVDDGVVTGRRDTSAEAPQRMSSDGEAPAATAVAAVETASASPLH